MWFGSNSMGSLAPYFSSIILAATFLLILLVGTAHVSLITIGKSCGLVPEYENFVQAISSNNSWNI